MCYQHHRSQPYSRLIVRGLWRMVVLSGLLWLLYPADSQAQEPLAGPIASVLSATVE